MTWRDGNDWFKWNANGGTVQVASLKAEKDPAAPPRPDALREQQLRTIDTLRQDKARRDAQRAQEEAWRKADPSRAPAPAFLGEEVEIVDSSLSPDAHHLLVVTKKKGADPGREGKMPTYVTESGYEEFEEARTRVGRNDPLPHALWLVDARDGSVHELTLDALPGIGADPLAALRRAAGKDPLKGNRPVQVTTSGDNGDGPRIRWSAETITTNSSAPSSPARTRYTVTSRGRSSRASQSSSSITNSSSAETVTSSKKPRRAYSA